MVFKWIWEMLKGYRLRIWVGLFLVLICDGLAMLNPYLSGEIVDRVIIGKQYQLLLTFLLVMVGSTLVKSVLRYTYQINFEYVSQNMLFKLRERLYQKVQGLDFNFFDRTRTGDIMNIMASDTETIRHFTAWVIYQVFENLI
ncbi:MAG TPA: ABC transporter transmembrane domain-containing protein, partial [Bacillota bacterium]|nr:ABC transporter transmembrane domain-containing protein [Bacillota bacterium]